MLAVERVVACSPVAVAMVDELRLDLGADLGCVGTASVEAAGGGRIGGARQVALEHKRLPGRVLLGVGDGQRGEQGERVGGIGFV